MGMLVLFSAVVVVLLLGLSNIEAYSQTASLGFPICSPNIYLPNGQLSIDATLYNCSANIPGPLVIRSYFASPTGLSPPVNMSLAVKINNLIKVDDITSEVQMGFFLRLQWYDERWYMPELFEQISPQASNEGLDITGYVRSQNPLNIWLPDVVYYEGTGHEVLAEFIRLFPNGKVYWSRNMLNNMQESQNLIRDYPKDSQNFSLTFQSYSHESQFLQLKLMSPPVVFRYNTEYKKNVVELNQLWTYLDYSAYITTEAAPIAYNPHRKFSSANINITFKRQSFGIVFRLALPVAMFMLIVGFSFWSDIDKRLDVGVQMLLIVTALYLIIGTVIPFVGYLTTMDQYMSCVFVLLSLIIGVHVITLCFDGDKEEHPMGEFYNCCIVMFFKIVWLPCAIAVFMFFFSADQTIIQLAFYSCCIVCASQVLFMYEEFCDTFKESLIKLRQVAEDIKKKKHKSRSGKLSGHDHHLIQRLSKTEVLVLRIFRRWYMTKAEERLVALEDKLAEESAARESKENEEQGTFAKPPSSARNSGRLTATNTPSVDTEFGRNSPTRGGESNGSSRYYHDRGYAGVDQQYRSNSSVNGGYDVVVGGEHY